MWEPTWKPCPWEADRESPGKLTADPIKGEERPPSSFYLVVVNKLYFLSDRTVTLKLHLREWPHRRSGIFVAPNGKARGFPRGFGYIGTWQNISQLFSRTSYQSGGQIMGCRTCQIPENGSGPTENNNEFILTL